MKENTVILFYSCKGEKQAFINELLKNCNINKESGNLYCKRCGNLVKIDWFRNLAYCGIHVISERGINYRDECSEIYV